MSFDLVIRNATLPDGRRGIDIAVAAFDNRNRRGAAAAMHDGRRGRAGAVAQRPDAGARASRRGTGVKKGQEGGGSEKRLCSPTPYQAAGAAGAAGATS